MSAVNIPVWEKVNLILEEAAACFIFYPGGKVEHTAYAPLPRACAERGILCMLVQMPCNLAVLNVNGADGIQKRFPEIDHWYIGVLPEAFAQGHYIKYDFAQRDTACVKLVQLRPWPKGNGIALACVRRPSRREMTSTRFRAS